MKPKTCPHCNGNGFHTVPQRDGKVVLPFRCEICNPRTKPRPAPRSGLVPVREISLTPSPQGFHLSAMVGGHLVSRHFIGYGKREAVAAFRSLNPIN